MSKGKGWYLESRRHKLSALGIKTGRKMLPKKPLTVLSGDQKMFYPKGKAVKVGKDTEKMTIEQPLTILKETSEIATGKKVGYTPKTAKRKAGKKGKVMDRQSEKMTVEQPITIVKSVGEIATSGMKPKRKNLNFTNLDIALEK